ncbi:hypothetical protein WJX72_005753 [[Myrmecia] bisecta]|uniref:Vesicle transport protein n=1 Tax=[Myrmecia] bisecta TaxID=41462 RepID=A0AAW1P4W8_9CHLO
MAQGKAQVDRAANTAAATAQELSEKAKAKLADASQQVQQAGSAAAAKAREVAPQVARDVRVNGRDIVLHAFSLGKYAPQRRSRAAIFIYFASLCYLAIGLAMMFFPASFAMALHMIRQPGNPAAEGMMRMLGLLVSIDAYSCIMAARANDEAFICARILASAVLFPAAITLFWAMGYLSTGLTFCLNMMKFGMAATTFMLYCQDQRSVRRRKVE